MCCISSRCHTRVFSALLESNSWLYAAAAGGWRQHVHVDSGASWRGRRASAYDGWVWEMWRSRTAGAAPAETPTDTVKTSWEEWRTSSGEVFWNSNLCLSTVQWLGNLTFGKRSWIQLLINCIMTLFTHTCSLLQSGIIWSWTENCCGQGVLSATYTFGCRFGTESCWWVAVQI